MEVQVGGFYLLSLLATGEPRGLAGATITSVKFQQAAFGRPLDDIAIDAVNNDGSPAYLDIQSKRTIEFTRSSAEFGDVVRAVWATAQKAEWKSHRYETAVAIARTSTRIERYCQQVLDWARRLSSAAAFLDHMQLRGFASDGMRDFVDAFKFHLDAAGGPIDDETTWQLLRHFQILVFDFEAPGSDYQHRAHERARLVLSPAQAANAAGLWTALCQKALHYDSAGGELDRPELLRQLSDEHGFQFADRPDLRPTLKRLAEATNDALDQITDHIGGVSLSRSELLNSAEAALDGADIVQISGPSGSGKSGIVKLLAARLLVEGAVLVLTPARIVGGGWVGMASTLNCPIDRMELFNELGCSGAATLFIDNIDQVDDPARWATLSDLLQTARKCRGWKIVFTVRSGDLDWRANLPDEVRNLPAADITVGEISDSEAEVLAAGNPAVAALLRPTHPARAIARNLFYLSRIVDLVPSDEHAYTAPASEVALAELWWDFGGGRSAAGKWDRLKLLRDLGEQLVKTPGIAEFDPDALDSATIGELLRFESLRESRRGSMLAFWHDTLRDWTLGFTLRDRPELLAALPTDRPIPGAMFRGIEIAARLALQVDATGDAWLQFLAFFERPDCHGSWRRPALLALPHSENAFHLLDRLKAPLAADNGRRIQAIVRHMLALETEPLSKALERAAVQLPIPKSFAESFSVPTGGSWFPLVAWLVRNVDDLPSTIIPDAAKVFQMWLTATRGQPPAFGGLILEKIYGWLVRIEDALRPTFTLVPAEAQRHDLDFDNIRGERAELRLTFFSFCELRPDLAAAYLKHADPNYHHSAKEILEVPGSALKAAPAAFVDFFLASVIPKRDETDWSRWNSHGLRPFDVYDSDLLPISPGQGPFLALLDNAPREGLRLIRELTEYATDWQRQHWAMQGQTCPSITIPFAGGEKVFDGDFGVYRWGRGGTGSHMVASGLMALEAWAHREIETGRPIGEVLEDVCGPSGSSIAFLCVAVDVLLSHWGLARDLAWPILAVPELLYFDKMRLDQDISGLGGFMLTGDEPAHWPVRRADLAARPSRYNRLLERIGNIAIFGPPAIHAELREALEAAHRRLVNAEEEPSPDTYITPPLGDMMAMALRACEAENWALETVTSDDGTAVMVYRYRTEPEEALRIQHLQAEFQRTVAAVNPRLLAQKALEHRDESSPQILDEVIAWARARGEPVFENAESDRPDDYNRSWDGRAIVMAAALAARDYTRSDWPEIETWALPVLERAAADESTDIGTRTTDHVCSNHVAIAALGHAALYCRDRNRHSRQTLLTLASRQDYGICNALGSVLGDLDRADERLPRSLTRLLLVSVSHPRLLHEAGDDAANAEQRRLRIAAATAAEAGWLDGEAPEPAWPIPSTWPSNPRRYITIGGTPPRRRRQKARRDYVDEHQLANWFDHLARFFATGAQSWVVTVGEHMVPWSIEANNGSAEDEPGERDDRPFRWNAQYFEFVGVLAATMPFDDAHRSFLEPLTRLHDEPFFDAAGALLRGFDRAVLQQATHVSSDLKAVRALIADRIVASRRTQGLNRDVSFTVETHLGDALLAMLYQWPRIANTAQPYIPERWDGLAATMPVLASMVSTVPRSGYVAVHFLRMIETCPRIELVPYVVQVVGSWSEVHTTGPEFWREHQIGHRLCEWFDNVLSADPTAADVIASHHALLGKCLDILIQTGIAAARPLEQRINNARPS